MEIAGEQSVWYLPEKVSSGVMPRHVSPQNRSLSIRLDYMGCYSTVLE